MKPEHVQVTSAVARLTDGVRTRGGATFSPRADQWAYRDGVHRVMLNFNALTGVTPALLASLKATLVWYAENRSASHLTNLFSRMDHFVEFLRKSRADCIDNISSAELLSYRGSLNRGQQWYLGNLAGLLKKWHALGLPGVSDDAVVLLNGLRLPGNPKGVAVLTMDTQSGPFTEIEFAGVHAALNNAFRGGRVDMASYLLAQLFMLLGQRPVQYAALKVCDVSVRPDPNGSQTYFVRVPRAKQRNTLLRTRFTERILISHVGELLVVYAAQVRAAFSDRLGDSTQAPLFPARGENWQSASGFEYHSGPEGVRAWLQDTFEKLSVKSERTGELVHIAPQRFRRTIATRAAEAGHGELIIAELLDHSDTQNVGIYVEATPAIVERIDRAVAMQMAPLAQAFAGVLIKDESEATRRTDPSSRIFDPRIDPALRPVGSCGQYGFCGLLAPIACYTCANFQPWLEGPHPAVLAHLLERREKLLSETGVRIASVEDRTILAVAEVIRRCEELRARSSEPRKSPASRQGGSDG